jgi:hypothetical protein
MKRILAILGHPAWQGTGVLIAIVGVILTAIPMIHSTPTEAAHAGPPHAASENASSPSPSPEPTTQPDNSAIAHAASAVPSPLNSQQIQAAQATSETRLARSYLPEVNGVKVGGARLTGYSQFDATPGFERVLSDLVKRLTADPFILTMLGSLLSVVGWLAHRVR